ncbi:hypothetical protein Tco_0329107 [Tanacetum coccineum]
MKRPTKGYSGQEVALFPTMLVVSEPSTSPSRITSSPSYSHEPSPSPKPSFIHSPDHTTAAPTQALPTQPSPGAEQHFPTPHDSPLHVVHSHGSDEDQEKKSKKELEQEQMNEEQMNEEQRAQIARDKEIARQWNEEERQRSMSEAKSTKKID